jgi:Type III secretion protein (HpaP)
VSQRVGANPVRVVVIAPGREATKASAWPTSDRFQRLLGLGVKHQLVADEPRQEGAAEEGATSPEAMQEADTALASDCPDLPDLPAAPPPPALRPIAPPPAWWAAKDLVSQPGTSDKHDEQGNAVAAIARNSQPQWLIALAAQVLDVCEAAPASFTAWSVDLPLDQDVLPLSTLRLHYSAHRLSLRFATHSAQASRLIYAHVPNLIGQLKSSPLLPQEVDFECS